MIKDRIYRIVITFSLGLFIQIHFIHVNSAVPNFFRYCSQGKIENVSQTSCKDGVNFALGPLQPKCICIQGLYKIYTDGCQEADGFASGEICTTLEDNETNANSWSMRLATIPAGFSWTTPAIACERSPGAVWSINIGSEAVTTVSDNFYAVNGKGFAMSDSSICVEPVTKTTDNICRYFHSENSDSWPKSAEYSISIKSSCSGGTALNPNSCFPTLTAADSECKLVTCPAYDPSYFDPNNTDPDSPSHSKTTPRPGGKPVTRTTKKPKVITKEEFDKNCTDPNDYRNHDNRFLNRKMLLYNVVNQLDMRTDPDISILTTMEPNKTLDLFDLMKNVTKKVCPTQYVNSEWIDQVVDLFYILHKGNVFRYEEQLNPEQYQWILDILTECLSDGNHVELTAMDDGSECSGGASGLATGYCKTGNDSDSTCDYVPVTVDITGEDSYKLKHYVPEVAWNIVDVVHVACFPQFNASYRMFHVLEQAVEKLFTLQIKNLWHHPGWLEKTKTKLLGFGADNNMHNFEVCLQGAYGMRDGDLPRLVRPFSPIYLRKKRAAAKKQGRVYVKNPKSKRRQGGGGIDPDNTDPDGMNPGGPDGMNPGDPDGMNPGGGPGGMNPAVPDNTDPGFPPLNDFVPGCAKTQSDLRKPPNCVWA